MLTGSGIEENSRLSGPVLTAYLNTQPAERARHMPVPASITWLKEAAKSLEPSLAAAEQVLSREQLNRIEEFLRDRHPHEKSVAVFAGRNAWQFVPLQVAVNNDLRWGAPAVSQLLWLVDERTGARFLRYQLRELLELEEKKFTIDISQWKMKDLGHVTGQRVHKTRGSQRDAFDHRVEAQYERLCRQAAQQAGAIYARERLQAIFLVGKDHLIELIEKDFPKELRHRVTLIKEDLGRSSVHELQNRLEPEIEKWEGQHEK